MGLYPWASCSPNNIARWFAINPQYAGPLYNLACCESLAGHTDDAIEHLRQAVERSERFREFAKTDTDFDPIREEPGFRTLIQP